jgi:hypothetical protein
MAELPPTPRIGYAHTSYLLTPPAPALAEPPPDDAALTPMILRKQFLRGLALALLPSLALFGLGLVVARADFLTAAAFAAGMGIAYNLVGGFAAMVGLSLGKGARD